MEIERKNLLRVKKEIGKEIKSLKNLQNYIDKHFGKSILTLDIKKEIKYWLAERTTFFKNIQKEVKG